MPLAEVYLNASLISSRLVVREWRPSGWRSCLVDNMTDPGLNTATRPSEKPRADGLALLLFCILWFMGMRA